MSKPIRIILVEDHPIVRQGLRVMMSAMPEFLVVGETGDGEEAVDLTLQLDPDVLLLDISLPNRSGLDTLEELNKTKTRCLVLILSMHAEERYVLQALRAGAAGYLLKTADMEEVRRAILAVVAGHRYLSAPLSDRAVAAYASQLNRGAAPASEPASDPCEQLTTREREVLQLMADGYSNSQIGLHLGISSRTAEVHRANVMRKLRLASQTDIVRFAIQRGLISIEKR